MKIKHKKYKKYIVAATLSMCMLGMGATLLINNNYAQVKAASYDDESYSITLSVEELSYTYENLANYLQTLGSSMIQNIATATYEQNTMTLNMMSFGTLPNTTNALVSSTVNNYSMVFNNVMQEDSIKKFKLLYQNQKINYENQLEIVISNTYYDNFKNAVELDIAANQPHDMGQDILSSITSGLGIIGDLAQEFLLGFGALFYANNQLTDFAIFGLVMLGIAISFAIVKLILSIIRSNTGV